MLSGAKPRFSSRDAFARRGEQGPLFRIAQRPNPQRIAGDDHIAQRVEKHEVIRPVESPADVAEHVDQRRPLVS